MVPELSMRRPAFLTFLRFIHDRNPFYLLSALSMFVGFRIILGALNSRPGDWQTLLGLIVTLNLYEVVMIALALFLIVRRGLERDGWILLGIEALFLVDLTNLNAELFTAMPRLGGAVNTICFLLAMLKIAVIVQSLGLRLARSTTLYIAVQLAFLFALPGIFRAMRSSTATISQMQIYAIWWIAAVLIACGTLLVKRPRVGEQSSMALLPLRLYVLVPMVSLLVHLASENRVYWIHFQVANLAPIFLAVCFGLNQSKWWRTPAAMSASIALMGLAVLVSIVPDEYHLDLLTRQIGIDITPMRVVLGSASLLIVYLTWLHRSLVFAKAAAIGAVAVKVGSDPEAAFHLCVRIFNGIYNFIWRVVPQTDMEWGVCAIATAFILLMLGGLISLQKRQPVIELTDPDDGAIISP